MLKTMLWTQQFHNNIELIGFYKFLSGFTTYYTLLFIIHSLTP